MSSLPPEDNIVDFSKFDSADSSDNTTPVTTQIQAGVDSRYQISKRIVILIIILMALIVTQGIIIIIRQRDPIKIPEGYRIIKPQNGPPKVEKISK